MLKKTFVITTDLKIQTLKSLIILTGLVAKIFYTHTLSSFLASLGTHVYSLALSVSLSHFSPLLALQKSNYGSPVKEELSKETTSRRDKTIKISVKIQADHIMCLLSAYKITSHLVASLSFSSIVIRTRSHQ